MWQGVAQIHSNVFGYHSDLDLRTVYISPLSEQPAHTKHTHFVPFCCCSKLCYPGWGSRARVAWSTSKIRPLGLHQIHHGCQCRIVRVPSGLNVAPQLCDLPASLDFIDFHSMSWTHHWNLFGLKALFDWPATRAGATDHFLHVNPSIHHSG